MMEQLRSRGLRMTPQRRAIVTEVMRTNGHISPTVIARKVQGEMPGVNASTVYRTLTLLEDVGVLSHSHLETGAEYHKAEEAEHVHLNRAFLAPGGSWRDFYSHQNVLPDHFFEFRDTEAPIVEAPFYYFLNESYDMLPRGRPTAVSGAVDIVAGVRDVGEFGRGVLGGRVFGDRNAPLRLQLSIASAADPARAIWTHTAIDFSSVVLNWRRPFGGRDPDRVETVFVFKPSLAQNTTAASFYFVTNRGPVDELRPIDAADGSPAWDTEARDARGRPLFPDGEYIVTVTAWDSHGNAGSASDRVAVRNQ